jgi:hypothetical protein
VRGIAPVAGAQRERDLRREEVLRADAQLDHVLRGERILDAFDVGSRADEVVDEIRILHAHRVDVDGQHGNRTDGHADAGDVGHVELRVRGVDEFVIGVRVGVEERRVELGAELINAADADLVGWRPFEAGGERRIALFADFDVAVARLRGGLDKTLLQNKLIVVAQRRRGLEESLMAHACADGEARMHLPRAGDAVRPLTHRERGDERLQVELDARAGIVLLDPDLLAFLARHGIAELDLVITDQSARQEEIRKRRDTTGHRIAPRHDGGAAFVVQRLVVVDAEREFLHRHDRAAERDHRAIAVMRE